MNEFAYAGEVTSLQTASPTLRELTDYVYFRRNVAGLQREWWQHRYGCEVWFLAPNGTPARTKCGASSSPEWTATSVCF